MENKRIKIAIVAVVGIILVLFILVTMFVWEDKDEIIKQVINPYFGGLVSVLAMLLILIRRVIIGMRKLK